MVAIIPSPFKELIGRLWRESRMKKVLLFVVALVVLSGCGYKAPPYYEPKSEEVKKVAL